MVLKKLISILLFFLMATVSSAEERRYSVPLDDSPVFGPAGAAVTMIEFLDYQ